MSSTKLRVGYVPEHFSSPLLILASTAWGKSNLDLVSQPSGTGQMLSSLDSSHTDGQLIDVAVALTESLIAAQASKGRRDYKLVGSFVRTSLNWAVITGTSEAAKQYNSIEDLKGSKIGISRIGSGSQIMASVMALEHGWTDHPVEFQVNDTFQNLRDSVNKGDTGAFMWEWFTTKPYQDSGEVRFIGSVSTPWPSWTIAASTNTVLSSSSQSSLLQEFLTRLDSEIKKFTSPDSISKGEASDYIINYLKYKPEDVNLWLSGVRWAGDSRSNDDLTDEAPISLAPKVGQDTTTSTVSRETLLSTLETLEKAGVCKKPEQGWEVEDFVLKEAVVE